eukprot:5715094-Pyramimonas_sp.AAC.1
MSVAFLTNNWRGALAPHSAPGRDGGRKGRDASAPRALGREPHTSLEPNPATATGRWSGMVRGDKDDEALGSRRVARARAKTPFF